LEVVKLKCGNGGIGSNRLVGNLPAEEMLDISGAYWRSRQGRQQQGKTTA